MESVGSLINSQAYNAFNAFGRTLGGLPQFKTCNHLIDISGKVKSLNPGGTMAVPEAQGLKFIRDYRRL